MKELVDEYSENIEIIYFLRANKLFLEIVEFCRPELVNKMFQEIESLFRSLVMKKIFNSLAYAMFNY